MEINTPCMFWDDDYPIEEASIGIYGGLEDSKHLYKDNVNDTIIVDYDNALSFEDWKEEISSPPDKSLVLAWDDTSPLHRVTAFYDKQNKCLFCGDGLRGGDSFDNVEVIPESDWPNYFKENFKMLED